MAQTWRVISANLGNSGCCGVFLRYFIITIVCGYFFFSLFKEYEYIVKNIIIFKLLYRVISRNKKKCMGLMSYYLIYLNVYSNTIPTLKWNVTSYSNIYSKTIFTRKCNVNFVFLIMNCNFHRMATRRLRLKQNGIFVVLCKNKFTIYSVIQIVPAFNFIVTCIYIII